MSDHTMNDLARRALAVHRAWLQLGNAATTTGLGTFVRNERAPLIWDANTSRKHARRRPGVDTLLARRASTRTAGTPLRPDATRPPRRARLGVGGYRCVDSR